MTEYKSKWGDFKSFVREKTSSFSEKDKKDKKDHTSTGLSTKGDNGNGNGHKRNVSNVPSISRERSSDSEDTSDDAKESAVELSGEATGELASKKSSRHSSKSSTSAPTILRKVEPIVLHGWTVTRPVGFRDVCKAVAETAFVTTNLPLIVSLEVRILSILSPLFPVHQLTRPGGLRPRPTRGNGANHEGRMGRLLNRHGPPPLRPQ